MTVDDLTGNGNSARDGVTRVHTWRRGLQTVETSEPSLTTYLVPIKVDICSPISPRIHHRSNQSIHSVPFEVLLLDDLRQLRDF
ncbi:unnamed protein product [Periconia digitata]|uniref:Uncharacterized protein n=1 Tax=Periconia digitata TaxID=1303443 RepID=A0A9W4UEB7_9PLEO|nr:unnamed protein product [Periconia digitata]